MKKFLARLTILSALMGAAAHAQLPFIEPPPPTLKASAWLLLDGTSGQVIASDNPDTRVDPASLTKLMTAYLVFTALQNHQLSLDQVVTVNSDVRAIDPQSSKMFLKPGDKVTIDQLLYGLLVPSGNDAAVALADAVSGDQGTFVQQMNALAKSLGMNESHFASPHGLPDPNTYTTVSDLAKIAWHVSNDFPQYVKRYDTTKEFTYANIKQPNTDGLLWTDPTVDGIKTGHTDEAGYCLVASAVRKDGPLSRQLISIVMGTPTKHDRDQEAETLLNWGYANYTTLDLYAKNQSVISARVWKGQQPNVELGFDHDVYVTIPRGAANTLQKTITPNAPLIAPLAQGAVAGHVVLSANGKTLDTLDLKTLAPVAQAGFVGRTWDSVALWWQERKSH